MCIKSIIPEYNFFVVKHISTPNNQRPSVGMLHNEQLCLHSPVRHTHTYTMAVTMTSCHSFFLEEHSHFQPVLTNSITIIGFHITLNLNTIDLFSVLKLPLCEALERKHHSWPLMTCLNLTHKPPNCFRQTGNAFKEWPSNVIKTHKALMLQSVALFTLGP